MAQPPTISALKLALERPMQASLSYRREGNQFTVWNQDLGIRFCGADTPDNRADLGQFAHMILVQRGQLAHDGVVELVEDV